MSKAQPSSKTNTNANTNQSIATLVLSDSESEASEEFEPEYVGAKRGRESSSELELSFKRLKTLAIPRSVVFRNTDQLSAQKSEKEELSPEMSDGEKLKKARNLLHNREFESAEALLRAMKKPGAEAKVYLAFIQQQLGRKLSHRGMKRK